MGDGDGFRFGAGVAVEGGAGGGVGGVGHCVYLVFIT